MKQTITEQIIADDRLIKLRHQLLADFKLAVSLLRAGFHPRYEIKLELERFQKTIEEAEGA